MVRHSEKYTIHCSDFYTRFVKSPLTLFGLLGHASIPNNYHQFHSKFPDTNYSQRTNMLDVTRIIESM